MAEALPSPQPLTAVILAGGASRRMGGQDKGLVLFKGRPLVEWVVRALAPQVTSLIIVANRNLEHYRKFGFPVFPDQRPDYPGPLAGFEAGLAHAETPWITTCPTDVPGIPADYVARLTHGTPEKPAVATLAGRIQPVFSLLPQTALPALSSALDQGQRKVLTWLETLSPDCVAFDDCAALLCDADSPEDLRALEQNNP